MAFVYFLTEARSVSHFTFRTSKLHKYIYHGVRNYAGMHEEGWERPYATNSNRQLVHIQRSRAFIPEVFSPWANELIVSRRVADKLQKFEALRFNDVVFEHLVDLPMPPLGTDPLPSVTHEKAFYEVLHKLEHVGDPLDTEYLQVLMPAMANGHSYEDEKPVKPDYGYYHASTTRVSFSKSMAQEVGLYYANSGHFVFSEDCFSVLAPFLNLDYYAVAAFSLEQRRVFTMPKKQ